MQFLDDLGISFAHARTFILMKALECVHGPGKEQFFLALLSLESLKAHPEQALGLFDVAQRALSVPFNKKLNLCLHAKEQ